MSPRPIGRSVAEADRLFRGTRWRGSDDAYSVDLGDGRSLWLFGDTFIADAGADTRVGSHFIHNSLGLQTGRDPRTAQMDFRWDTAGEVPGDALPGDDAEHYLWPYDGARIGDRVLVFAMEVGPPSGQSGGHVWDEVPFTITGWRAYWLSGLDQPLAQWEIARVEGTPARSRGIVGAAVLLEDNWLYAWSYDDGRCWLVRWELSEVATSELRSAQWWDGAGWSADPDLAAPALEDSTTEFTVHARDGRLCLVDVAPFGRPDSAVNVRWASRPEGPWTERAPVFVPPEAAREGILVYAGKAHPELSCGEGLLVTYAQNTSGLDDVIWNDESIYYPRFVELEI